VISSGLSKWVKNRAITWCSGAMPGAKMGRGLQWCRQQF